MAVRSRLRIGPALAHFEGEIRRLVRFNRDNQQRFINGQLSQSQINLLVESVFFNGFRYYENYLREAFLLCCLEKIPKRPRIRSYLHAKNFEHSEKLIKSTSQFVDWSHPDKLIERAKLFLENGYPIEAIINSHLLELRKFKRLRNHIAHDSVESLAHYKQVVSGYHAFLPLVIPPVGEFLMLPSLVNPGNNLLDDFFIVIRDVASNIAS